MKNRIKLSESQLHSIIKEAMRKKVGGMDDYSTVSDKKLREIITYIQQIVGPNNVINVINQLHDRYCKRINNSRPKDYFY